MSDVAKPWVLSSNAAIASVARKLIRDGAADEAFILILGDVCAARFEDLARVLASLADIGGVQLLFVTSLSNSYAAKLTYEMTGLPVSYFPLFAAAADLAREVAAVRGDAMGPKAQLFVLERALATPQVKALNLPQAFIERLCAQFQRPAPGDGEQSSPAA